MSEHVFVQEQDRGQRLILGRGHDMLLGNEVGKDYRRLHSLLGYITPVEYEQR